MKLHTSVFSALLLLAAVTSQSVDAQQVGAPSAMSYNGAPAGDNHVATWFAKYDAIRRGAQMTPQERQRADNLMSKGLSLVVPGPEKAITQQLLVKLINKNKLAADQMKMLQLYPETEQLHRGYYQYFSTASGLFSDYLRVQSDFMARDANGAMLAGGLMNRKQQLAALDENNKMLDGQIRQQFGIPAYRY
ncbi:MAG TPA: hypothetical protein V6C76_04335 [Drouetiella sp.]